MTFSKTFPPHINSSLFADDAAFWTTADDLNVALRNIQEAIDLLMKWTGKWGLLISK